MSAKRVERACLAGFVACAMLAEVFDPHGAPFWIFTLLLMLQVRLAFRHPSWFFLFATVFLILGCWLKVVIHRVLSYEYMEPRGGFSGVPGEWDVYYYFAAMISLGLIVARILTQPFVRPHITGGVLERRGRPVSTGTWLAFLAASATFYAVNNAFAFFVTGVNPRLVLPFSLNAPLAFLAFIGVAIAASLLLTRDIRARGFLHPFPLIIVLVVLVVASLSMASRAVIVLHGLPMLMAATLLQHRMAQRRTSIRPYLYFSAGLLVVLIGVSAYRIVTYSGASLVDGDLIERYVQESAHLFVDRWIGAEPLMVAVAESRASPELMLTLLTEDPSVGAAGTYQSLSMSAYNTQSDFTFLALPGYYGVLALSGSGITVLLGVMLIGMFGILFERFAFWASRASHIVTALASAAVANAFSQISFPLLVTPFVVQLGTLLTTFGVCAWMLDEWARSPAMKSAAGSHLRSSGSPTAMEPASLPERK
jgi:hypothetical protein